MYGVASLAVVDQSYSHRLDEEVDDRCIFCHSCISSVSHILWKCCHPRLVAARNALSEDVKQAQLEQTILDNCDHLPLYLRNGIPPSLALTPNTPWWTNTADAGIAGETKLVQEAFGIDQSFHFDGPFMSWLEPYTHLDGKRAFADINGSGHLPDLPAVPPEVVGTAPDEPTVFTDGSFSEPRFPCYSLPSAGIWWPQRNLNTTPLLQLENGAPDAPTEIR